MRIGVVGYGTGGQHFHTPEPCGGHLRRRPPR